MRRFSPKVKKFMEWANRPLSKKQKRQFSKYKNFGRHSHSSQRVTIHY